MKKNNPHDKLFKRTFAVKSQVVALIQTFLSPELNEALDLDTLESENVSFITNRLEEYFSDIVYSCQTKTGEDLRITLLLEHKSYDDPLLPFQLWRYLLEAYDYQVYKQKQRNISLCVPVVIYHGTGEWKMRKLSDMFKLPLPHFAKYVPDFSYDVVDLRSISEDYLKNVEVGYFMRGTFLLFKHKNDKQYVLENFGEVIIFAKRSLNNQETEDFTESLISYLYSVFSLSEKEKMDIKTYTQEILEEGAYYPDSSFGQAVSQGREEGREEGREIGELINAFTVLLLTLKKMPEKGADFAASILNLNIKTIKRVEKILSEGQTAKTKKKLISFFFKKMKLSEKELTDLYKKIADYYSVE